jgi:pyruvate formate lyase activating enzyme
MVEIKGFLETSFLDWPGKISAVLFLPGCNFRCPYCHNHPLIFQPEQFATISLREILQRLQSFRGWIDGVCITGGEPTLHPDLPLLIHEIRERGFRVKLDTNGSHPELLEKLIEAEAVDFVSMDVKAPLDHISYRRSTGCLIDLSPITQSIEILKWERVEYQFRMTVVPPFHNEEEIQRLARQLKAGKRFVLQNFNPENPLDPSLKNTIPYDPKLLKEMERRAQKIE